MINYVSSSLHTSVPSRSLAMWTCPMLAAANGTVSKYSNFSRQLSRTGRLVITHAQKGALYKTKFR